MNFGGINKKYSSPSTSFFSVIPVPYDLTSTYGSGARRGPMAILEASANMELYDEYLQQETYLVGIHTDEALNIEARGPKHMVGAVEQRVKKHLNAKKFPVLIGGEHSLSFGSLKAVNDSYPNIAVLHLDAHADLRDSYQGSPFSHASVARRIAELCPIVQVGIRSLSAEEAAFMRTTEQIKSFFAEYIHSHPDWKDEVITALQIPQSSPSSPSSKANIYITIDLDVFDPAIMPATGTPEPNGLLWRDVLLLLEAVARQYRVVGFDVVELAPLPGIVAPDFLAAKLIYSLMGFISKYH